MLRITHIDHKKHVEFVAYSGKYPALCSGVLTLRIDGKEIRFGSGEKYKQFWRSGGFCMFDKYHQVKTGEWVLIIDDIPEKFQKFAFEIDKEFNANVPYGCCGGCDERENKN